MAKEKLKARSLTQAAVLLSVQTLLADKPSLISGNPYLF